VNDAFDRIEQQLMLAARTRARCRPRRLPTKTVVALAAIGVVGTGGAVAAIKTTENSGSAFPASDAASYAAAARAFGVFRHGTAAQDGLAYASRLMHGPAANDVDPDSVRLARVDGDVRMYALAGGQVACLLQRSPGGGQFDCSLIKDLADGSVVMFGAADLGNGSYRLTGLVADGVRELVLETGSGAQPLAAENNVIAQTVDSKPLELTWTAPDGSTHRLDVSR
jgi:hypothetical protein